MSFKISYWSGWLLPEMEGISKEVYALAKHFNNSPIFGFNKNFHIRLDVKRKLFGFNVRYYLIFKAIAPLIELRYSITHIYDDLANWFYLKNLGKRPIVLTATVGDRPLDLSFYKKVKRIVVDSKQRLDRLSNIFPKEKLELIYPGIDIKFFTPITGIKKNPKVFKVLFASSPATPEEMEDRGVYRLLDCASMLPDIKFTFLWRPWGTTLPLIKDEVLKRELKNITIYTEVINDMREIIRQHHIVVAPFSKGGGKPCPTSVLEALSCGLPAVVGSGVEIGDILEENSAGIKVNKDDPNSMAIAIDKVRKDWIHMKNMARKIAEKFFDQNKTFLAYEKIYNNILNSI